MPGHGSHPGFVVGYPNPNPVAEMVGHDMRIFRKGIGGFTVGPATFLLKSLRKIVVKQANIGLDLFLKQFIHQTIVKIQPGLVDGTPAFW